MCLKQEAVEIGDDTQRNRWVRRIRGTVHHPATSQRWVDNLTLVLSPSMSSSSLEFGQFDQPQSPSCTAYAMGEFLLKGAVERVQATRGRPVG